MWLSSRPEEGIVESSDFSFARLRGGTIKKAPHGFETLESFKKIVDGSNTADGLSADGVALWDIERLEKGHDSFQSVKDWR